MQPVVKREPSLGELFSELAHETGTLVKQEVELAKTEMVAKTKVAARGVAWTAAGAAVALAGGLTLIAAVCAALALVLPVWAATLITGAVVIAAGTTMALHGVSKLKHLDPVPRQTIEVSKENGRWISEQFSR